MGAVAVSESNPDVVYIGMGETELRGNIMQGDGVYKSTDAGKTWKHVGLADTQAISRIRVHPTNPDIVYVSALGHPYGPNAERGVFRSKDGGKTWKKVLYRDDHAGAVDLCIDPHNPNVLFAAIWDVYRTPWWLTSGGPGSGLFKSTDGGDHWTEITRNSRPAARHHRQDRRRRFGRGFQARLRHRGSRERRRLPSPTMPAPPGSRVSEDRKRPPARVLLLAHLCRSQRRKDTVYVMNTAFLQIHRRRQRRSQPIKRRTATITISGSTRPTPCA